jgi:hypothetical protein
MLAERSEEVSLKEIVLDQELYEVRSVEAIEGE